MSMAEISYKEPVNFLSNRLYRSNPMSHISCEIFLFLQNALESIELPSDQFLMILQERGVCLVPEHTALE